MTSATDWTDALTAVYERILNGLLTTLPNLIGALALIFVGWVLAKYLRLLAVRFARYMDRMLAWRAGTVKEQPGRLGAVAEALGSIVFWFVILFFLTVAAQVLGLEAYLGWVSRLTAFLPTLFTSLLIVLVGYVMSILVRDLVSTAAAAAGERQQAMLGRAVQAAIISLAVVIGADQIGIKVTFLMIMATVVASTILGGTALAMSLGARSYVSNLIGAHVMRRNLQIGQTVRIHGITGRLLDMTPTAMVLETDEGRATVPARLFLEEATIVVMGGESDGRHP